MAQNPSYRFGKWRTRSRSLNVNVEAMNKEDFKYGEPPAIVFLVKKKWYIMAFSIDVRVHILRLAIFLNLPHLCKDCVLIEV